MTHPTETIQRDLTPINVRVAHLPTPQARHTPGQNI